MTASKLILDRLYPSIGQVVIKQTLSDNLAPDSASALLSILSDQGKLIELHDLTARIEDLENNQ